MEDLSSLNSISMNVAAPIVASFGLRSLAIPVQTFTTQSEADGQVPPIIALDWLQKTLLQAHQQFAGQTNYGLIGYLGTAEIVQTITQSKLIDDFNLLVVDPVMADQGKFYPLLDQQYLISLKQLLTMADVVTPNLTELALLTGHQYRANISEVELGNQVAELRKQLKADAQVIVTGIEQEQQIGCYWDTSVSRGTYYLEKVPGHFYGTGDAFAAILLGKLAQQIPLVDAIPAIMQLMQQVVQDTLLAENDLKLGIDVTRILQRNWKSE